MIKTVKNIFCCLNKIAVQTQAGWAKANGVNLLAAGYNNPKNKNGGSGIYTADGNLTYIMPTKNETSVITMYQIPIIKKRKVSAVTQVKTITSADADT